MLNSHVMQQPLWPVCTSMPENNKNRSGHSRVFVGTLYAFGGILVVTLVLIAVSVYLQGVSPTIFGNPGQWIRDLDGSIAFQVVSNAAEMLAAILATSVAALALSLPVYIGVLIAAFAMLGDLISSFAKRRLGIASSDMALGIDQIPESLLPLLVVGSQYKLDGTQIMLAVVAFFAIELILSRVLYNLKIRDRPH